MRRAVIERDGAACVDCGRAAHDPHHIIPRSMLPGRLIDKRDDPNTSLAEVLRLVLWRDRVLRVTVERELE